MTREKLLGGYKVFKDIMMITWSMLIVIMMKRIKLIWVPWTYFRTWLDEDFDKLTHFMTVAYPKPKIWSGWLMKNLCVFMCLCVCVCVSVWCINWFKKKIWRLRQFARQWGNSEQTAPQSLSPGYLHLTTSCNKIVISNFFRFYIYSQVELLTSAKSFSETQSLLNLVLCIFFLWSSSLSSTWISLLYVIFLFTYLVYQTMVLI